MEDKNIFQIIESVVCEPSLASANRLSIINGKIDISEYNNEILEGAKELLGKYSDESQNEISKCIVMVILAELYYQKDDCFNALIMVNSALAFLGEKDFGEIWTVAKYIQMCILIVTGQLQAIYPTVDGMKERVFSSENAEVISNYEALRAWCALYDDDWNTINSWMNEKAPNEHGKIDLTQTSCLLVKARIYYMRNQNLAAISLLQALEVILEKNNRTMDLCELYLLVAMAFDAEGHHNEAYEYWEKCLAIAESRNLVRLLADEGEAVYRLMRGYCKERNVDNRFYQDLRKKAKDMALMYPRYLRNHKQEYVALTSKETEVLKLLVDERSNVEIADFMGCSLNTVKFHLKNIFRKLGVNNRTQAMKVAVEDRLVK